MLKAVTRLPNLLPRASTRDRRRTARLADHLARLGPIYNVGAYRGHERLLKETLTAATSKIAIGLGSMILRKRGFALKSVALTAVRLSPCAVATAVAADARFRRP